MLAVNGVRIVVLGWDDFDEVQPPAPVCTGRQVMLEAILRKAYVSGCSELGSASELPRCPTQTSWITLCVLIHRTSTLSRLVGRPIQRHHRYVRCGLGRG